MPHCIRLLFLWLLLGSASVAQQVVYINSPSGEHLGQGKSSELLGDFQVTIEPRNIIVSHETGYSFSFRPAKGQSLARGGYLFATNHSNHKHSEFVPGLSVKNGRRECSGSTGFFYIHELDMESSVPTLALDLVHFCNDQATEALTASIRLNSIMSVSEPLPMAVIHSDDQAIEQGMMLLDGRYSLADGVSYHWQQLSGPDVHILDPEAAQTWLTLPGVAIGGEDVTLRLVVEDRQGRQDASDWTFLIRSMSDPMTFVTVIGDDGDLVTAGKSHHFNLNNSDIKATVQSNASGYETVSVRIQNSTYWHIDFRSLANQSLAVGQFKNAGRYPFASSEQPAFNFSGDHRGCGSLFAEFFITEYQLQQQNLESMAATFQQRCGSEGAPRLRGLFAFNSPLGSSPTADPGPTIQTFDNSLLTLNASASTGGKTDLYAYDWQVFEGDLLVFRSQNPVVSVRLGSLKEGIDQVNLVAKLVVTNMAGFRSMAQTYVIVSRGETVVNPSATPMPSPSVLPSPSISPLPSTLPSSDLSMPPSGVVESSVSVKPSSMAKPKAGSFAFWVWLSILAWLGSWRFLGFRPQKI